MSTVNGSSDSSVLWVAARWITLLITVGLIVSFWVEPTASLRILWYALIPVLPAVFLVNVELWRNICPLATLNILTGRAIGSRKLSREAVGIATLLGIVLLVVMVPARRFLFNVDASVLGATVIAVCVLAMVGGLLFDMKAGFCTSICPVLPVERLYGQRPLLQLSNARCPSCSTCSRVCLDLVPTKSAEVLSVGANPKGRWTTTAYGAFAVAFPGFVIAYYTLTDTSPAEAGAVYGLTATLSVASWVVLTLVFHLARISPRTALVWCAALAVGLYYWYAPSGFVSEFGLPESLAWPLRVAALGLVLGWLVNALRPRVRNGPQLTRRPPGPPAGAPSARTPRR